MLLGTEGNTDLRPSYSAVLSKCEGVHGQYVNESVGLCFNTTFIQKIEAPRQWLDWPASHCQPGLDLCALWRAQGAGSGHIPGDHQH